MLYVMLLAMKGLITSIFMHNILRSFQWGLPRVMMIMLIIQIQVHNLILLRPPTGHGPFYPQEHIGMKALQVK